MTNEPPWDPDGPECPCCLGQRCGTGKQFAELQTYKKMLDELLQNINRDYGHYVTLAGYPAAVENASFTVTEQRRQLTALRARIRQLRDGE